MCRMREKARKKEVNWSRLFWAIMFVLIEFGLQLQFFSKDVGISNRGIAFGLGVIWNKTVAGLGIVVMLIVFRWILSGGRGWFFLWTGGLANLLTRFVLGSVRDYINLLGILWVNLADILISIGVMLILVSGKKDSDPV